MKTKFSLDEITSEQKEKLIKYKDFQKKLAKEIKRLGEDKPVKCIVITKHSFGDGKTRPLLILGISPDWKKFTKTAVKKNRFFGMGTCSKSLTNEAIPKLKLNIEQGKVSRSQISKAIDKHPPATNALIELALPNVSEEEAAVRLQDDEKKRKFKLFTDRLYAKIQEGVKTFQDTAPQNFVDRSKAIKNTLELISQWFEKHEGAKKEKDKNRKVQLEGLKSKMTKALAKIEEQAAKSARNCLNDYKMVENDVNNLSGLAKENKINWLTNLIYVQNQMNNWSDHYSKIKNPVIQRDILPMYETLRSKYNEELKEFNQICSPSAVLHEKILEDCLVYEKTNPNYYDSRLNMIYEVLELIAKWMNDHGNDENPDNIKIGKELSKLEKDYQKKKEAVQKQRLDSAKEASSACYDIRSKLGSVDRMSIIKVDAKRVAFANIQEMMDAWKIRFDPEQNSITRIKVLPRFEEIYKDFVKEFGEFEQQEENLEEAAHMHLDGRVSTKSLYGRIQSGVVAINQLPREHYAERMHKAKYTRELIADWLAKFSSKTDQESVRKRQQMGRLDEKLRKLRLKIIDERKYNPDQCKQDYLLIQTRFETLKASESDDKLWDKTNREVDLLADDWEEHYADNSNDSIQTEIKPLFELLKAEIKNIAKQAAKVSPFRPCRDIIQELKICSWEAVEKVDSLFVFLW